MKVTRNTFNHQLQFHPESDREEDFLKDLEYFFETEHERKENLKNDIFSHFAELSNSIQEYMKLKQCEKK